MTYVTQASKETFLTVRMPAAERAAVEAAAEADGRTTSSLVRKIISDWLATKRGASGERANTPLP